MIGNVIKRYLKICKEIIDQIFPKKHQRPWGYYQNLFEHPNFKIKKIVVFPRRRLSLQKHFYRREHWFVLFGLGKATVNNKHHIIGLYDSIDIPKESIHRLINGDYNSKLMIIEIQIGRCDESDIVRIEDDYGRGIAKLIEWEDK